MLYPFLFDNKLRIIVKIKIVISIPRKKQKREKLIFLLFRTQLFSSANKIENPHIWIFKKIIFILCNPLPAVIFALRIKKASFVAGNNASIKPSPSIIVNNWRIDFALYESMVPESFQ